MLIRAVAERLGSRQVPPALASTRTSSRTVCHTQLYSRIHTHAHAHARARTHTVLSGAMAPKRAHSGAITLGVMPL